MDNYNPMSDRSAGRLMRTRREIDRVWEAFVEEQDDYDSISEINLKVDDLLLSFAAKLTKENKAECLPPEVEHDWGPVDPQCGVRICYDCRWHEGLAKCFCGWNLAPGERLEDDVEV